MKPSTSNHMKAPQSASFVAALRNVFGNENVKVLYVKEGDVLLGEKQPEGATCFIVPSLEQEQPKKLKKAA
jgi:hypothetical protein